MIEAIKETLALHEKALEEGVGYLSLKRKTETICPLCDFAKKEYSPKERIYDPKIPAYCQKCPWIIFEGHPCEATEELLDEPSEKFRYSYYDSERSVKRLRRWLEKLEE